MLGRGTASTRLKQPAASQQWHDGKHFCACSQFKDGEEVGQIITQDVACHGDDIVARFDLFAGEAHGGFGGHRSDVQPCGVVIGQVLIDFGDDIGIVGAVGIEPEDGG